MLRRDWGRRAFAEARRQGTCNDPARDDGDFDHAGNRGSEKQADSGYIWIAGQARFTSMGGRG